MSGGIAAVADIASGAPIDVARPARFWRIVMVEPSYADMWDVQSVQFRTAGAHVVAHRSSGDAGPGYEADHAFADGLRWWGGRPDPGGGPAGCHLGVEFDQPVVPSAIAFRHAVGPHRAERVAVESSDDGSEWTLRSVVDIDARAVDHTPFYAPDAVRAATGWRLVTRSVSESFAWDVHRLLLLRSGVEVTGVVTASGAAGTGFEIDNTLADGASFWGGRPDDDGRFDITVAADAPLELDRIVLEQGDEHWARTLLLERRTERGEWRTWRHFRDLVPGRNDLFLYTDPTPLSQNAVRSPKPPKRFGTFDDRRILVLIASYRDPELPKTIRSALAQAAYPEHVRFAICHQVGPETQHVLAPWSDDPRFTVDQVDHSVSRGCCWARHRTFTMYDDEPYILQIDAHTRFAARWDVRYVEMLEAIDAELPILSTYPPRYTIGDGGADEYDLAAGVQQLYIEQVRDDLTTEQRTSPPADLAAPAPSPTLAAGQLFTRGRFCRDVPYDPEMYFAGEEISLAARAFTHGYDMYSPNENLVWHLYAHRHPKHWEDHHDHHDTHAGAMARLHALFRGDAAARGEFGLGSTRSLADFEDHAGIDLGARRVASDGSTTVEIDRSVIEPRDDYRAFVVVFLDGDGDEVDRRPVRAPDVLDLSRTTVRFDRVAPTASKYVVVPVTESGWLGELVVRRLTVSGGDVDR